MDAHFRLVKRGVVERVDEQGVSTRLDPPAEALDWASDQLWGYHGSGPNQTAATLLTATCTGLAYPLLDASIMLVKDLLARLDERRSHVLGVAEVVAWCDQRLPFLLQRWAATKQETTSQMAERLIRQLQSEAELQWLEMYRAQHGLPQLS
jgi:hypothetical protein